MTTQRLIEQVKRQLTYIERSCRIFDSGDRDEAIRIATHVRTLFHNTKNTKSLISYFHRPHLHLLSTIEAPSGIPYILLTGNLSKLSVEFKDGCIVGIESTPYLQSEADANHRLVPLHQWWNEQVYVIDGQSISRSDIVLWAANKDGGAHVDIELPQLYMKIIDGIITISHVKDGEICSSAAKDAHLADLRQIGHEVLNSPCVQALAR